MAEVGDDPDGGLDARCRVSGGSDRPERCGGGQRGADAPRSAGEQRRSSSDGEGERDRQRRPNERRLAEARADDGPPQGGSHHLAERVGVVADLGHLGALSVWIGGLVVLALSTRSALTTVDDVKVLARRFSPIALASVGVLVVTGSVQSWRQLGDRSGLSTPYGRILLLKLGLVGVVLLTAWTSRRTVGAWRRGAERDVFIFGRHLVTELVVIGTVLVATSALVATQPGRETAGGPVTVEIADKDTRLTMTIDPARHGTAAFHLYLSPPGGALQQVKAVTMQLSLAGTGIDRLEVPLDPAGPNHFTTESGSVPLPGRWQVKVSALLTEFDERVFTTTVRFR